MKQWLTLVMCLYSFLFYGAELPYPYNTLSEVLPFNPHSLYRNEMMMTSLIKEYDVKIIVELGSWVGASTRHFAREISPHGKVYAVDHWLGSTEHESRIFRKLLPTLYQQFLSNVIHEELTDQIIPIKMPTHEASQWFKIFRIVPDMIYVDASHDEDSVYQDLSDWFPLVCGHGIMCGDDWDWPGVNKAVSRFASENNLVIENDGLLWYLREIAN